MSLARAPTAAAGAKVSPALFDQLEKALKGDEGAELVAKTKVGSSGAGPVAGGAGAIITCCLQSGARGSAALIRACHLRVRTGPGGV